MALQAAPGQWPGTSPSTNSPLDCLCSGLASVSRSATASRASRSGDPTLIRPLPVCELSSQARDVTVVVGGGGSKSPGKATASGHYEQEEGASSCKSSCIVGWLASRRPAWSSRSRSANARLGLPSGARASKSTRSDDGQLHGPKSCARSRGRRRCRIDSSLSPSITTWDACQRFRPS